MSKALTVFIFIATCLGGRQVFAQAVSLPICTVPADQDYPAITADGLGNAIVVWHDRRNGDSNGNNDLYAQKISIDGLLLWQADGAPVCTEPGNQGGQLISEGHFRSGIGAVQIAPDGSGGAIVAWRDDRNGQFNGDVYAQRIYANGQIAWASEGVAICTAANEQSEIRIINDGAGGAIITWEDFRVGNAADIYAQRIDGGGNAMWQQDGIAVCSANSSQRGPQIVTDAQGGAIIVWIDLRSPALPPQYDIYAQHISSSGAAQWASNGIPICTAPDDQYLNFNPSVVADGFGGAIIAWHDERSGGAGTEDIYAQRVNSDGVVLWQSNGVPVCTAAEQQTHPVVAADQAGGAFIAWRDYRLGILDYRAYIQRIDPSGVARWSQNGVPVSDTQSGFPVILATTSGNSIVLWQDFRAENSNPYIQGYDSTGTTTYPADGQLFVDGPGGESQHVAVPIVDGHFITAWQDDRSGSDIDIYAAIGGNAATGGQAIAIPDRFVDSGPEAKFLPLLRNDVLPVEGQVEITITSPPQFGTILSIEENGVWYQTDQEMIDEFSYSLTLVNQTGGSESQAKKNRTVLRQGNIIVSAFLCACGIISECSGGDALTTLEMLTKSASARPFTANADSLDLPLLLRARDEILVPTTVGADLVETFMFNSPEILQVLVIDRPDLLDQTMTALEMLQSPARSLLDGDGNELLTQALMDTIQSLLTNLGSSISSELNQELQQKLAPIGDLDDYVGMTVGDAAATALNFPTKVDDDNEAIPDRFDLAQNYPNPFNPTTTITYSVASTEHIRLVVYDVLGREVATLVNESQKPGKYTIAFDAKNLASGVYFARLKAGRQVLLRKMLLIR